jgi:hypothetical protein
MQTVTYIPNDPDHEGWGWGWLERWMVARPWRNRSFIDATDLTRKVHLPALLLSLSRMPLPWVLLVAAVILLVSSQAGPPLAS